MSPEDRLIGELMQSDPLGVAGAEARAREDELATLTRVRRRIADAIATDARGPRSSRPVGRPAFRVSATMVVSAIVIAVSLSIGAVALLLHGARPPGSSAGAAMSAGTTAASSASTTAGVNTNAVGPGTTPATVAAGTTTLPNGATLTWHSHAGDPNLALLKADARALYAPVRAFERSLPPGGLARSRAAAAADGKRIDRCQRPYQRRLLTGFPDGNNPRYKLYTLYENGATIEQYQRRVAPIATQLSALAAAWSKLQLSNPAMNDFVHAMARQLNADVNVPPFDTCAFVQAIAAHNYSYAWARSSSYARAARSFQQVVKATGNGTGAFWEMFQKHPGTSQTPLGLRLFTNHQFDRISNLPGIPG